MTHKCLLLAPLALCACVAAEQSASEAPSVGMANPASVFCVKQGGTLKMREETGGTVGYCRLTDGSVVEEWAYFRANMP